MTLLVFKNFLSASECAELNKWVELGVKNSWLDKGLNIQANDWSTTNRLTTRAYGDRFDYSQSVYSIQDKITKFLKIQDLQKSVAGGGKNGIVVSYTLPGGDIHEHMDPKEGNLEVLRCNVITQAAASGGSLYFEKRSVDVQVGDLHCYLPSTIKHSVSTVQGNTPRILWMFGYQCSIERFEILKEQYEHARTI